MELSLQEPEAAINYWREQMPARGSEFVLSPEVNVLARVYAPMIFGGANTLRLDQLDASARQLLQVWRAQQRRS